MAALEGQVALITGCARYRGIGRAMALALAGSGADLAITDIAQDGTRNVGEHGEDEERVGWTGLDSLAEEVRGLGRRVLPLLGDVARREDAERMVRQTLEQYGRIDILINNAGAPHGADRNFLWEVPEEAFDAVMAVNPKGNYLMSVPVIRHMFERGGGGRIINIASVAGKTGHSKRVAYCASKFAVIGFTLALSQELAPHGITVNAICPGAIETARNASSRYRLAAKPDEETEASRRLIGEAPVGRIGQATDIAHMALFLADPGSDFITGQAYTVDGGLTML
jgi:NAD(P)-dependent dehydrogenase (short-subunit alcohol dehydrogenase family)